MSAKEESLEIEEENKSKGWLRGIIIFIVLLVVGIFALGWYWSIEPPPFNVKQEALNRAKKTDLKEMPVGYVYGNTLAHIAEVLLFKSGGYITNDVAPPGILVDDITSFEYGALVMLRDATSALRNHLARAQSQSAEDPDLAKAEPYFYYENNSWALPSTEAEYKKGVTALHFYIQRLIKHDKKTPAHFYARADNLWQYVEIVIKRLGGLSTRLNANTSRYNSMMSINTVDQNESEQKQSAVGRTAWLEIDNVFWEARGAAWALLHILKAVKYDFEDILLDKRAMDTVDIMIREMANALEPVVSPVILNGDGFGIFANYSLAMANYISRANAAALDLRDVMNRG